MKEPYYTSTRYTAAVRTSNLLLFFAPIFTQPCAATIQLLKQGGGDDAQLSKAWGKVGAYYTERGKWGKAVPFFKQAKDLEMLAECFYRSVAIHPLSHVVDGYFYRSMVIHRLGNMMAECCYMSVTTHRLENMIAKCFCR